MTPDETRRRQQEEQARRRQQAQQNKPPAIGTKRADGKVYSGENYGYQSAGSHAQLKKDGKFKAGTQAIDRAASAAKNFVKTNLPGVANAARNYQNTVAENARRTALRDSQTTVGKGINAVKAVTNAPAQAKQAAVNYVSNKTNVDPRIVRAGAEVVGGVLKTKAGQGIVKASGGRIAPPGSTPNRSVGAAAKPAATAPTTKQLPKANRPGTVQATRASGASAAPKPPVKPAATQPKPPASVPHQAGKPLGGTSKQTAFRELYHGTSPEAKQAIQSGGFSKGGEGKYGAGTYTSGNRNVARSYARMNGATDDRGLVRVRVPAKDVKNVRSNADYARARQKPSPAGEQSPVRQAKDAIKKPDVKGVRISDAGVKSRGELNRPGGGLDKRGDYVLLKDDFASRNIVKGPNNRFRPTAAQRLTIERGRPARSVGAAAPTKNPARPQPGARLGGPNKRIAFQNTYHGTSARDAASIRANGYRPSATGVYGPGVYTGNRKMARGYADSAGIRAGDQGAVLRHRVPKKNQANVPFEKPEARQRVSPQSNLVQQRLREGKTTRVDYGNGSQVTNLTKAQADKTLVKPNGNIRLNKAQQAKAQSRSERLSHGSVSRSEAGYFKPGRRQVNTEQIAQNIERQLKANKNGFTVDPRTGKNPTRGTQVAIDGRVLRDTSPEGIRRFVARNKDLLSRPDVKVGGWTSERSGKPVLELSRRVRNSAEAQRLGKKFQQEGIWDSKAGKYVSTGGTDQLRHTKGAQTKGGSRIGGQTETARLKVNRQGTVKRPSAVTAGKTQETQGRKVNLGNIQRGAKNFTPGRRAQAVQRANSRVQRMGGNEFISNNAIGVSGSKIEQRPETFDISFAHTSQKQRARGVNNPYASRRELGDTPKSKGGERLRSAGLKDQMGRLLNINPHEQIVATPTTGSRGALYGRATKGALAADKQSGRILSTRVGPDMWINNMRDGKRVKFNPNDLREPLKKLAASKATRVGRAAGGTSKKPALITGAPKNVIRDSKADRAATKAKPGTAARKKAEAKANRTPNGNTIRERQGVVRSNQRSRVSADQRQRTRLSTVDENWDRSQNRQRTPAEQAAVRRFTNQDPNTRDRGGRRTWNGRHETRRLRIRRS